MTKYHKKIIIKIYDNKRIHNWTGTQLTNGKKH